ADVGPRLAEVVALQERAIAQAGEHAAVGVREGIYVRVERPLDHLPRSVALPAVDRRVGRPVAVRLEGPGRGRDEPALRVLRIHGERPRVAPLASGFRGAPMLPSGATRGRA